MYRSVLWTLWERERVRFGRMALKHVKNIMYEMSCQSRFNAQYWMLGAGALGRPTGMMWGGRRVQDGEHMYTCGRFISIFGRNQYNIVKLKNKIKKKHN